MQPHYSRYSCGKCDVILRDISISQLQLNNPPGEGMQLPSSPLKASAFEQVSSTFQLWYL